MIGLMRKDLFVSDKTGRLLVVFAFAFSFIPRLSTFGSTYAMMLTVMMPMYCIAYDERSKWDKYAAMLPYTPGQLVGCKYLVAGIYVLLGVGITVLGALLRGRFIETVDWKDTMQMAVMLGVAMPFVIALSLPCLYRFGAEKGRFVMIAIMGVCVGVALGLMGVLGELPKLPSLPLPAAVALIAALLAATVCISFRVSVHFYRKRQNGAYD